MMCPMDLQPPGDREPRSSFEDFDPSEIAPASDAPLRRPATLTTAAIVLLVAAAMNVLFVVGFRPEGATAIVAIVSALGQAGAAVLILARHPAGYLVGIIVGGIGIASGLLRAGDDPLSALMTVALGGFVIWAVAANKPSFRRG